MKHKLIFTLAITVLMLLLNTFTIKAQDEMDFEEFMGMMSETLTEDQLNELSYLVPWNVKVTGYAYGDFSGDGIDDIVLSLKEKDETPSKSVDVYFFQNLENKSYSLVKKKNYKWREVVL